MNDDAEKELLAGRVAAALPSCTVDELHALVRMVRAIERRRGILMGMRRRRDRARRSAVHTGLRELRDATPSSPPALTLIDGGGEG